MMQDVANVRNEEHEVRAAGVGVSIDAFATGYSALDYLQKFSTSGLKIDRSFVRNLNGKGSPIVAAITGIARGFGLAMAADGVDHPSQIEPLRSLGCDILRAYLFCKPAREAETMFLESRLGVLERPDGRRGARHDPVTQG